MLTIFQSLKGEDRFHADSSSDKPAQKSHSWEGTFNALADSVLNLKVSL